MSSATQYLHQSVPASTQSMSLSHLAASTLSDNEYFTQSHESLVPVLPRMQQYQRGGVTLPALAATSAQLASISFHPIGSALAPPLEPTQNMMSTTASIVNCEGIPEKTWRDCEEVIKQVDTFCDHYIKYLSHELLQTPAPPSPAGIVAAADAAASLSSSASSLTTKIQAILSDPQHQPSSIAGLPILRAVPNSAELSKLHKTLQVQQKTMMKRDNSTSSLDRAVEHAKIEENGRQGEQKKEHAVRDSIIYEGNEDQEDPEEEDTMCEDVQPKLKQEKASKPKKKKMKKEEEDEEVDGDEEFNGDEEEDEDEYDEDDDGRKKKKKGKLSSQKSKKSGGRQGGRPFGGQLDCDGKQRRSKMSLHTTTILREFFVAHVDNPFPKEGQKKVLAEKTGLRFKQVSDWFTNTRKRFWTPYKALVKTAGCILATNTWGLCACDNTCEMEVATDVALTAEVGQPSQKKKKGDSSGNKKKTTSKSKKEQIAVATAAASSVKVDGGKIEDAEDDDYVEEMDEEHVPMRPDIGAWKEHDWRRMWD